jgi:sec-independent protein translocase protein TatA
MPWGITPAHLVILLVIVLIIVGPGKLPDTGAAIGKALRGFKNEMDDPNQAAAAQQPIPPAQQVPPAPVYQAPVAAPTYAPPVASPTVPQQPVTPPVEPPAQG